VALQGGSQDGGNSGEDSSNNGLVFIGEALEAMVNQKRMDFEGVQKTDLHRRSAKRTALRGRCYKLEAAEEVDQTFDPLARKSGEIHH
jgi:hypothetical protein